MSISYKKLWKRMIEYDMNKTQLGEQAHLSTTVIAKLGKNESISMDSLEKICIILECNIGDIVEFIED